ncbi:MAG: hypothetical protein SCK28_01125 [Bacillota bacterium]|nr:hypothetical protein [Bacillota bacterium]
MLISTSNVIAIRCPECGSLDFHLLSLFSFGKKKKQVKIDCSCGTNLVTIGTKDWEKFWMQTKCIMCETKHLSYLSRRRIWSDKVEIISCDDMGVEIGFIGPKGKVKDYIHQQDKSLREMAEEMGFGDYFDSPEVMYEVLDYLYEIAEDDSLYCECGNYQVDIEVFPERLELICGQCDCSATIYAESEQDILLIKESAEIKLTKGGFNIKKSGKLTKGKKQHKK